MRKSSLRGRFWVGLVGVLLLCLAAGPADAAKHRETGAIDLGPLGPCRSRQRRLGTRRDQRAPRRQRAAHRQGRPQKRDQGVRDPPGRPVRGTGDGPRCGAQRPAGDAAQWLGSADRIDQPSHRRTRVLRAAARALALPVGSGRQEVQSVADLHVLRTCRPIRSSSGFQPYNPASPPSDVAQTKTDQGVTVPFIVRTETGYMDRDQYQISVLYQPGKPWSAVAPQPQFDHKMLILHGASCGVDHHDRHRSGDDGRRRGRLRARQGIHDDVDGARQQRPQLRPAAAGGVAGHGKGARHQVLRHAPLHDRHRMFGRLTGAAVDRERLPGRVPGNPADLLVPRCLEHRDAVPRLPPPARLLPAPHEVGAWRRVHAGSDGRRPRAGPTASRTPRSPTRRSSTSPFQPIRARARRPPTATTRSRTREASAARSRTPQSTSSGRSPRRCGPPMRRRSATASCDHRSTTSALSTGWRR